MTVMFTEAESRDVEWQLPDDEADIAYPGKYLAQHDTV